MTDQLRPLEDLKAAVDASRTLITRIRDDQWTASTPCSDWTVRDVVGHLVGGSRRFVGVLTGQGGPPPPASASPGEALGEDPLADFDAAVADLIAAFGRPEALAARYRSPIGEVPGVALVGLRTVEHLVHGWDIAQGIGTAPPFDPELAARGLTFTESNLANVQSGRTPFGPPQPAPADASPIDRLAALLGRQLPG